jgi:hypothetical protein
MNRATIPDAINGPECLVVCDDEYLEQRETFTWNYYREMRPIGSIFSILYYLIYAIVSLVAVSSVERSYPAGESVACGFCLFMLLAEIISLRLCHIGNWRPADPIPYIYPGVEMYFLQYIAAVLGAVIIIIVMIADGLKCDLGVIVLGIQHVISVIAPWFFLPCFLENHRRGDRVFKWVRLSFFRSMGWTIVRVLFFVFLTPGIYGIQVILAYDLRNKPRVVSQADELALVAV